MRFNTLLNNIKFTYLFLSLQAELVCCNTLLVVESATGLLNLITSLSEIYVHSTEILTTDYGVINVRLLAVAFQDPKLPKWHCPLLLSLAT
jgi:hypothetical protein